VTVTGIYQQHPRVYTICVAGRPTTGAVEKTALGRYLAVDSHHRRLGTYQGLQEAVERVVREEAPRG
jgi:hypothetical protein